MDRYTGKTERVKERESERERERESERERGEIGCYKSFNPIVIKAARRTYYRLLLVLYGRSLRG